MHCIVSGRWHELDDRYAAYKNVKDELAILDGLVLRGERFILPEILQNRAVNIALASHQGIVKTEKQCGLQILTSVWRG